MDFENFWQENKRFLGVVFASVIVFFIALSVIDGTFDAEANLIRRALESSQSKLRTKARYTKADEGTAGDTNLALQTAVDQLSDAVAFNTRPEFALDPKKGSPESQYFGLVDQIRNDLETLAGRRGMRIPEGLGLAMLETNSADAIERHLQALDLIDRVLRLSLDAGVGRADRISVRLDPAFSSRGGLGTVEKTRIEFKLVSRPEAIVDLIDRSQSHASFGQSLIIDDLEITGARAKADEVSAIITFLVVRLRAADENDESLGA